MDDSVVIEDRVGGEAEAIEDPGAEADLTPNDEEPAIFLGEVPPEEEIADADSRPVGADAPVLATNSLKIGGDAVLSGSRAPADGKQPTPDRPIKIVLTVRPGRNPDEPSSALVAVGSEGRAPILRYLDSGDLAAALVVVPDVVVAAIAAWSRRMEPRPVGARPAPAREASVACASEPSGAARAQPALQSRRTRGGESSSEQPSLFG